MERARNIEERHEYEMQDDGAFKCLRCGKWVSSIGRLGLIWDTERCPKAPVDAFGKQGGSGGRSGGTAAERGRPEGDGPTIGRPEIGRPERGK